MQIKNIQNQNFGMAKLGVLKPVITDKITEAILHGNIDGLQSINKSLTKIADTFENSTIALDPKTNKLTVAGHILKGFDKNFLEKQNQQSFPSALADLAGTLRFLEQGDMAVSTGKYMLGQEAIRASKLMQDL